MTRLSFALIAAGLSACGLPPVDATPDAGASCQVSSLTPSTVFVEGADIVSLVLDRACAEGDLHVEVGGTAVETVRTDATHYTFVAPPFETAVAAPRPVAVRCGATACTNTLSLTYDPALEPAQCVQSRGPEGTEVSVLAKVTVTLCRAVDPALVTSEAFSIVGVAGTITHDADNRTFHFTPNEQLEGGKTYTARVAGLTNQRGTVMEPVEWTFRTNCHGCEPTTTQAADWCPVSGSLTLGAAAHLVGADDQPVNGPYELTYRLYDVASGGTALWSETITVTVVDGDLEATLGLVTPLPETLIGKTLFLELSVNGQAMSPRLALKTAPPNCP